MLASSAAEMVSLFLALELLAINLYVLAGLARRGAGGISAGLGYLVLGGASAAVLLDGLSVVFGLSGETRLPAAGQALAALHGTQPALLLALCLVLAGFALRMGLLPVRWWTRGFETGVPPRVIMFALSVGVAAAFAVFGRIAVSTFGGSHIPYAAVIAVVAALAMTGGNLLALTQSTVRRLVVYSGIAQAGYGLVAFTDLKRAGIGALLVFLTAMALTGICAFAVILAYARSVHRDAIRDLAAMSRTTPGLAIALGLAVVSLAGLPPVAGFFGQPAALPAPVDGGLPCPAGCGACTIVLE